MSEKPAKYVAVEDLILTIRGQRVILDADIALLYGVSTKRLNEQIKRNQNKFPSDFMFRLTVREKEEVVANCDNLKKLKFPPCERFTLRGLGGTRGQFHYERFAQRGGNTDRVKRIEWLMNCYEKRVGRRDDVGGRFNKPSAKVEIVQPGIFFSFSLFILKVYRI